MRMVGASAVMPCPLVDELRLAISEGRPILVYSDGEDATAIVADDGDIASDVAAWARQLVPALAS